MKPGTVDDHRDSGADAEIIACLDLANPRSFFLFAGAGSGKTRSLVKALDHVRLRDGQILRLRGQRVAVITYTNAASEEIQRRLQFDPVVEVRTIHSFAWALIGNMNHDIREWLRKNLVVEIQELRASEAKGRKGTKASLTRLSQIDSKSRRLEGLDGIRKFTYSPTGDNRSRDSLSHSEVIKITAHFLVEKEVMVRILIGRYPILLIDESQDTNKLLIDALFQVQSKHRERFCLGLIGDMMQRIYMDGKEGLDRNLPSDWATPSKVMNHRSPTRVVDLINRIRRPVDDQQQMPRSDSPAGHVRLFIFPSSTEDKPAEERAVAALMAEITGDTNWLTPESCKTLTLEHRMAARRMGFLEMFIALYEVEAFRTGLLDGSLPTIRFFTEQVLPLVKANKANDRFEVARILRNDSPLLTKERLEQEPDQRVQFHSAQRALDDLMVLFNADGDPTFGDVLRNIARTDLLHIPDRLHAHIESGSPATALATEEDEIADPPETKAAAIQAFLDGRFSQAERYLDYVSGTAPYDTHQGVKGLEFPRVMVIMDDSEARGFQFSYEKLFGAKDTGDTSPDSTRRLFYVTCSRSKQSLALVAYSAAPGLVRQYVIDNGWFLPEEVHVGPVS